MGCLKLHNAEEPILRLAYSRKEVKPLKKVGRFYPFGLEHKGYNYVINGTENNYQTFQGQELEEELGKNTYAFQWRDYDPAIARFGKIDRFAEQYYPVSPYAFTANNPILFREIKGDTIRLSGSDEFKKQYHEDMKILKEFPVFNEIITYLENHKQNIYISEASSIIGSIKNMIEEGSGDLNHVLSSSTEYAGHVEIEYSQIEGVEFDGIESESSEVLLHELVHAFDFLDRKEMKNDYDKSNNKKNRGDKSKGDYTRLRAESRAVAYTNLLRSTRGKELRKTYGGEKILKDVESAVIKKVIMSNIQQ